MKKHPRSLTDLTDEQLLVRVRALASRERKVTSRLIASLAELDARRLYLAAGFPSLFSYCTEVSTAAATDRTVQAEFLAPERPSV